MNGYQVAFFLHENHMHGGVLTWQWLLREAEKLGIGGGSAFRAAAGFGRHHVMRIDQFFGSGVIGIKIEFLVTEQEKELLFDLLTREKIELFCSENVVRFGPVGGVDSAR